MDSLIQACCGSFCTAESVADVEAFFAAHPFPKNAKKIASLLETMRTNVKFLELLTSSRMPLLEWLEQQSKRHAEQLAARRDAGDRSCDMSPPN